MEEKDTLKKKLLTLLPHDVHSANQLTKEIENIFNLTSNEFHCSRLLELFVHTTFEEEDAAEHWNKIFSHYDFFTEKLGYCPGLNVVICDYFTNQNNLITNPIIVEVHVFKETEKMAMVDPLTSLFNRRYFDVTLKKELKRALRYDNDFSLMLLDLDNFKQINDTRGHLFGDEVLRQLSALMLDMSREEDIVCRYGGEEFILILPETSGNGALAFGERIKAALKSLEFFSKNNITISGGISAYPYGGNTPHDLIENADKALYEAKFSGKDCFIIGTNESRRRKRFKKTWKISYKRLNPQFADEQSPGQTYTQDISYSGVRLEIPAKLDLGTRLILEISLPNAHDVVMVSRVVWSKILKSDNIMYGLEFVDLKDEQFEEMKEFLPQDYKAQEDDE